MAFAQSGSVVSTPRLLTVVLSLVIVALALASLKLHMPAALAFVAPHRLLLLSAGYAVLLAGVLLRRL